MEILGLLIISLGGLAINHMLINTRLYNSYKSQAIIYIIFYYLYNWYGLVIYQIYDWFVMVYVVLTLICFIYEKVKHTKIDTFNFNKYFGIALSVISLILVVSGLSYFVVSLAYGIIWFIFSKYQPISSLLSKHIDIKDKLHKIAKNKFYVYSFVGVLLICLYILYNPFAGHIYQCIDEDGNKDYVVIDKGIANYGVRYVRAENKKIAEAYSTDPSAFEDAYETDKSNDCDSTLIYHSLSRRLDTIPNGDDGHADFGNATVHNHRLVKQDDTSWKLIE